MNVARCRQNAEAAGLPGRLGTRCWPFPRVSSPGTNLPASLQHPHVSTRKPLAANKAEATMASPEGFVHGPGHPRSRVASPSGSQGGSHPSRQLTLGADPVRGGRDARAREPPLSLSPLVSSSRGPRRLGLSSHLPRPRPRRPRAAGDAGSTGTRPFRPLVGSQPGKDQQWAYARDTARALALSTQSREGSSKGLPDAVAVDMGFEECVGVRCTETASIGFR